MGVFYVQDVSSGGGSVIIQTFVSHLSYNTRRCGTVGPSDISCFASVIHQEDEVTVGPVHHPESCLARAVQKWSWSHGEFSESFGVLSYTYAKLFVNRYSSE